MVNWAPHDYLTSFNPNQETRNFFPFFFLGTMHQVPIYHLSKFKDQECPSTHAGEAHGIAYVSLNS